ncbi:MAG: serine/threonine protein kinase, partial [Myxococcales bacterium]|nr:serine/threonine protein kinase [Myxococcales bacterium]
LARIEHPGVVKIHRTGRDGDLLFLVMELVRGVSLDRIVADLAASDGPPTLQRLRALLGEARLVGLSNLLPPDDDAPWWVGVTRITAAILQILEAVHERGVLHRDLKPSNVMLRVSGHPVLLDFGMASFRDQEGSQLTSRLYGTLQYLAPEQLRDSRTGKDERTDVYQVGAILYEFLTLRRACDDLDALRGHR